MNRPALPFDILGQIGPILAWTEGGSASRLPHNWTTGAIPFPERERSWLLQELPTYSYDNVDDILRGTRAQHRGVRPVTPVLARDRHRPSLSPPPNYDLLQAFRKLNAYFFVWTGTEPCVRAGRMEELHELAIRMPAGHVVRHVHARAIAEGSLSFQKALELPEMVTLLPSNSFGLRSVIRRGLSESHLHLNGVTSAEESWADDLLRPLSGVVGGRSDQERRLLVLNLYAGRLLALAVWASHSEQGLDRDPRKLLQLLDQIYFARTQAEENAAAAELRIAIREAVWGKDTGHDPARQPPSPEYAFLLRWIAPSLFYLSAMRGPGGLPQGTPEGPEDRCRFVDQLHLAAHLRLVQLTRRRPPSGPTRGPAVDAGASIPELRRYFLHEALFRYLVCRTHYWQTAAQQGRTTGLQHFRQYFDSRQRRPHRPLPGNQYEELVFNRLRRWRGLRVLEGRVSPPRQPQDLAPWILAYAKQPDRIQKFGLVIHFKKEIEALEEPGFSRRSGTHSPDSPVARLRWGKRRRLVRDEAMRLYRLLQQPTPISPFVVGIDACNLELATPPEVFAPVFRFLRELPINLRGSDRRYSPYFDLDAAIRHLTHRRRLGMTYHVGEDFRHLLSGLRAICEVIDFLKPQPGDRLGHGTALALQPKDWLEHNGYQAVLPKLEWLDTLVWVHHFLGPGDEVVGALGIEDKIQRCSWEIYNEAMEADYDPLHLRHRPQHLAGDEQSAEGATRGLMDWNWSPLTLWDAWTLRQLDPYSVNLPRLLAGKLELRSQRRACEADHRWYAVQERVLRTVQQQIGSRNAYLLLGLYWLSPRVRERGEEVIVVDMQERQSEWLELCRRVEEKMKVRVHENQLVVEVNPSSNRIIGPMERYGQHHVFNLTLDENRRLRRSVRVSVNTDNPAVCNTTLAHEHYLLGEILMAEGVPEAEVVEWLEWLRKNGEEYNFVRRLPTPDQDPDMKRLVEWLRSIRPTVRDAPDRTGKLEAFWRWRETTRLRDHGFPVLAIERDSDTLSRLAALEAQAPTSPSTAPLPLLTIQRPAPYTDAVSADLGAGDVRPPAGKTAVGLRILAGSGTLAVETASGHLRTLPVEAGQDYPLAVQRILAAGTDPSVRQVLLYLE